MKKLFISLIFILSAIILPLCSQAQQPTGNERRAWMKEMQQYKHDFISKKLSLTDEQKDKFFPLYDAMDKDIRNVQKETEELYRQTSKKEGKVSDIEYEKAAEAIYELKGRENQIEMRYFNDFKKILTPQQLFLLKDAERDFIRELMKHRRRQNR